MTIDEVIAVLSVCQHGLVARRQLDIDDHALARRVKAGSLTPLSRDVLAVSGAPRTDEQHVMAAVLEAGEGALASHCTAAALWRVPGFGFLQLEVTMGGRGSSRARHLAFRHRPVLLLPQHQTSVDGIPCTSLARTIFDLASSGVSASRLERIVNLAVNRSPGTLTALHRTLDELARRGRPGITVMRAILDERPLGSRLPQSGLEMRFEKILQEFGEPPLERQVDVGGHEWLGRVDFLDRSLLLIVEVDSVLHHTSPFDRARDAARDADLLRAGYRQVLRVPEEHIWYQPHLAASAVKDARRVLRAVA
jgi:very-short-patch-repair endonuclease